MAKPHSSGKRLQIDKANTTMFIVVAITAFLVTFSIVAGKALLNTRSYQARVIKEKEAAATQLKANIEATSSLVTSYKAFVETPDNIIGGNPDGTGERDGDNAKIVLDALPSKYDYPALASSLEKILAQHNQNLVSISGTDEEVLNTATGDQASQPVEMPFEVEVDGSFVSDKQLSELFQRSIRPIKVKSMTLTSEDGSLNVSVRAVTYFQPAKTIKIDMKEVQ